jgi:hypothetical protein
LPKRSRRTNYFGSFPVGEQDSMPISPIRAALVAGFLAAPAFAQLPTRAELAARPDSTIVARLPSPALDENAGPVEFLRAAENALAAGRTGEAQEAMEMAQTRLLIRAVPLGTTGVPSDQPAVKLVSQALQALAEGDRATCLRMIQAAAMEAAKRP